MKKFLLITGLGVLMLTNAHAQLKHHYNIPRSIVMPLPASVKSSTPQQQLFIDAHLLQQQDQLTSLYPNGDTLFSATIKNKRLHGNWISRYPSGQLLDEGKLVRGIPDGEWRTYHADGSLRSIRQYDAEKLAYVKEEIKRKEARNTHYVLTGIARRNQTAANHLMTAAYSFHLQAPSQVFNSIEKRIQHNATQTSVYLPPFDECLHHGLYMNFFPAGMVKDSGYYKNGVRDGSWKEWNTEGNLRAEGMYKQGKPHADWRFFNKEGKLLYIQHYNENGKLKETIKLKG